VTLRLIAGLAAAFVVFDRAAALTGSTLGQAGLLVGALAVGTIAAAERLLFPKPLGAVPAALGFGRPSGRAVVAALAIGAAMLAFFPLFGRATGTPIGLRDGWPLLLPGLVAQGGIAEECLFRGYLFGHLRRERSFWRAAWLSVPPFVAVHLLLFTYMPAPVAAAATLLSLVMSFPLARLYDLGRATIWAPALLHFVAQAAPKLAVVAADRTVAVGVGWMAVCALMPWVAFAVRRPRHRPSDRPTSPGGQASSSVPP
jgi:membrane protease YdiL (CAAX protease family)